MIHEADKNNNLIVEEVKFNLEEYIKDYIRDKNLEESIKSANILLLPYQNFREREGPIFPEAYLEFYQYLLDNVEEGKIEFCAEEEDYKEIALHDETFNLGLILLNGILLPVIANIISEYIKSKLGNKKASVRVTFIEQEGDKYKRFDFEGDSKELNNTVEAYLKKRD